MKDEGSIVLGWLTRLVLSLALLGLVVFDGIAVVAATFTAADHATLAATAAADSYHATGAKAPAYFAALAALPAGADTIDPKTFRVDPDGRVTLHLTRTATTLWLFRIGPLAKYTHAHATGVATAGP